MVCKNCVLATNNVNDSDCVHCSMTGHDFLPRTECVDDKRRKRYTAAKLEIKVDGSITDDFLRKVQECKYCGTPRQRVQRSGKVYWVCHFCNTGELIGEKYGEVDR